MLGTPLRARLLSGLGLAALLAWPGSAPVLAQVPPGYYDSVDISTPGLLRSTLHAVIDDHQRVPYTSSATDTWDVLEAANEDPADAARVLTVYRNASFSKAGGGNGSYNREHTWPKSFGFPNNTADNSPHTDCHMLWLAYDSYNSARGNKAFGSCSPGCTEYPTLVNDGQGGGAGVYPGQSNWGSGTGASGIWEAWTGRRGDVARSLLYADVRYEGGVHGVMGTAEPDLILTNDIGLIASSSTGNNEPVAYMGRLSLLMQWHLDDPVDDWERERNDVVASFQGNRNPFVDHPEWVACLFSGSGCGGGGDVTPPLAPNLLVAGTGDGQLNLDWADNLEPDLAGYTVYRAASSGGPYVAITGSLVAASDHVDSAVINGVTYYYVVSASDLSLNESGFSLEALGTPADGPTLSPWINELHYDNVSTDTGEFVELAGPAGMDLTGWNLVFYNGSGAAVYATAALSGVIPDQGGCLGTLSFAIAPIQNGGPDGLALVDPSSQVVEFLSYEGSFVALGGPASGLSSIDIGVSETNATPVGTSLQRSGSGAQGSDFSWLTTSVQTPGALNNGQLFDGCAMGAFADVGGGLAGTHGVPVCVGSGTLMAGDPMSISLSGALETSPAWLVIGLSALDAPFKGGTLVPNPDIVLGLPTDGAGAVVLPALWPAGVPPGFVTWFQWWIQDSVAPKNLAASNGLSATAP